MFKIIHKLTPEKNNIKENILKGKELMFQFRDEHCIAVFKRQQEITEEQLFTKN